MKMHCLREVTTIPKAGAANREPGGHHYKKRSSRQQPGFTATHAVAKRVDNKNDTRPLNINSYFPVMQEQGDTQDTRTAPQHPSGGVIMRMTADDLKFAKDNVKRAHAVYERLSIIIMHEAEIDKPTKERAMAQLLKAWPYIKAHTIMVESEETKPTGKSYDQICKETKLLEAIPLMEKIAKITEGERKAMIMATANEILEPR